MEMDRIYKTLNSNKTHITLKIQTKEIIEEGIFDDNEDDIHMVNAEDNFDITDEDIFGEDTKEIEIMRRISELEKENRELGHQNLELQQQLEILENMQGCCLSVQKEKKNRPPAYRDDINLDDLVSLYKKQYSMNKIGKILNCNPKTVKSRLIQLEEL